MEENCHKNSEKNDETTVLDEQSSHENEEKMNHEIDTESEILAHTEVPSIGQTETKSVGQNGDSMDVGHLSRKESAKDQKKIKSGKVIFKWVNNILTTILILLFIGVAALVISTKISDGEPQAFGYQIKTVLSGSMEPGIKTGSIIFVKTGGDMTRFKENDIITFMQKDDKLVTHRVTEVIQNGDQVMYRTKGDNNEEEDLEPVQSSNVVAEYTGITIPYVGYVADFASSKIGILSLVILPGVFLLLYSVFSIWKTIRLIERQMKGKQDNSTEASLPK